MDAVRKALSFKGKDALRPGVEALVAAARTLAKDPDDVGASMWKYVWQDLPAGRKQEIVRFIQGDPRLAGLQGRVEEAKLVESTLSAPSGAMWRMQRDAADTTPRKIALEAQVNWEISRDPATPAEARNAARLKYEELEQQLADMRQQALDSGQDWEEPPVNPTNALGAMPAPRNPTEQKSNRGSIPNNLTEMFGQDIAKDVRSRSDPRSAESRVDDLQEQITEMLEKSAASRAAGDTARADSFLNKARELFVQARSYAPQGGQIKTAKALEKEGKVPVTPPVRLADSPMTLEGREKQLKRAERLGTDRTQSIRKLAKRINTNQQVIDTARNPEVSALIEDRQQYGTLPLFQKTDDARKQEMRAALKEILPGAEDKQLDFLVKRLTGYSTEGIPNKRLTATGMSRSPEQYMEGLRRQLISTAEAQKTALDPRTQAYIARIRALTQKPTALTAIDPGVGMAPGSEWSAFEFGQSGEQQAMRLLEQAAAKTRVGGDVTDIRKTAELGDAESLAGEAYMEAPATTRTLQAANVADLDLDKLLPQLKDMDSPLWDVVIEEEGAFGPVQRKLTPQEITNLLFDRANITSAEAQRRWRPIIEPIVAVNVERKRSRPGVAARALTDEGRLEPIKLPQKTSRMPGSRRPGSVLGSLRDFDPVDRQAQIEAIAATMPDDDVVPTAPEAAVQGTTAPSVVDAVDVQAVPGSNRQLMIDALNAAGLKPLAPISNYTDSALRLELQRVQEQGAEDMARRPKAAVPTPVPTPVATTVATPRSTEEAKALARVRAMVNARRGAQPAPGAQPALPAPEPATTPVTVAPEPAAAPAPAVGAINPELAPYLQQVQAELVQAQTPAVEARVPDAVPATPAQLAEPPAAVAQPAESVAAQIDNAPIGQRIATAAAPNESDLAAVTDPAKPLPTPAMAMSMEGMTAQMPGVELNMGELPPPAPPRTPAMEMPEGFESALDPNVVQVQTPQLTPSPVQIGGQMNVGGYMPPPGGPSGGPPSGPPGGGGPPPDPTDPQDALMRRLGRYTRQFGRGFVFPNERTISNDIAALGGSLAALGSMAGEEPASDEDIQRQLRALTPANPAAPPQPSLGPAQPVLNNPNQGLSRPEDTVRRLLNNRPRSQPSAMQQLLR
jgi:hypothetical protein